MSGRSLQGPRSQSEGLWTGGGAVESIGVMGSLPQHL